VGQASEEASVVLSGIGPVLPYALAVTLSPFPVVGAILVARSPHGMAALVANVLGWMAGIGAGAVVMALLVNTVGGGDDGPVTHWAQVIVGLLLLWAAWRKFAGRPKAGEVPTVPKWLEAFGKASPARAFGWGLALAGPNPKNLALAMGAMSALKYDEISRGDVVAGVVAFVIVGSLSVLVVLGARLLGGARLDGALAATEDFMIRNNAVIMMMVFALIGMNVLGVGLAGLGG